jgi:hypothetical protein
MVSDSSATILLLKVKELVTGSKVYFVKAFEDYVSPSGNPALLLREACCYMRSCNYGTP